MRVESLKAFLAVLEYKSFTKAAESLFLTQSALSRQIAEIERAAGQPLLQRTTRRVRATAAGRIYEQHARRIIREWDALQEKLRELSQSRKERLTIGYTTSEQLPFILEGMKRDVWRRTGTEVTMRRVRSQEVARQLRAGVLDCAVAHRPTLGDARDLELLVLARPHMTAVVPADCPLAARESVRMQDLVGYSDVRCAHERDPAYYDAIDGGFEQAGYSRPALVETGESEELAILVRLPMRMSLCPSCYPPRDGFRAVRVTDFRPNFDFLLARPLESPSPQTDVLAEAIREQFGRAEIHEKTE